MKNECELKRFMSYLVVYFEQQFSVFKQHYTYFHILFYQHIFSKNTNNITITILLLLNKPLKSVLYPKIKSLSVPLIRSHLSPGVLKYTPIKNLIELHLLINYNYLPSPLACFKIIGILKKKKQNKNTFTTAEKK